MFYIDHPLEVFPLFARLVAFKYGGGGFPGLARGVDVRDSFKKKCRLSPLPEPSCLDVKPGLCTLVCRLVR